MKTIIMAIATALLATTVLADEPPMFFQKTYPTHALKAALDAQGY